jgi:hypothetical protein
MKDPDDTSKTITEEDYIYRQGKLPLINNQIGQLIKNLKGQYRNNDSKPSVRARKREDASVTEMITNALQYVYDVNEMTELDSQVFLEFLLSGITGWKTGYEWVRDRNMNEVVSNKIQPTRIFFNTDISDVRLKDLRVIGEIIDTDMDSVLSAYAKDPEEEQIIRDWYNYHNDKRRSELVQEFGSWREDGLDFYYPVDDTEVRVIEVWMLKNKTKVFVHDKLTGDYFQHPYDVEEALMDVENENDKRLEEAALQGLTEDELMEVPLQETDIKNEEVWCYYMLTPWGHVLDSGETPYEHESHPYTLRLYPMIDSEVRAFVEDVIDQQKHINRLITMMDFMISASAKGVLMIPEDVIPKGYSPEDFAKQWRKTNGYIMYTPSKNHSKAPEQITSNAQHVGAQQLLMMQMELFNKISGVTEAIQGQTPPSGTPASLYAQQATNATLSTKDYFEHFNNARKVRDYKLVKLIQQFYDEERYVNVSGQDYADEAFIYKPDVAKDVPVDIVLTKSGNSPVYRQMIDEYLMQFLQGGLIDLPMFLENTSIPFADKLLQQLKERQQQTQDQLAQLQQQEGIDPQAQQMTEQLLG